MSTQLPIRILRRPPGPTLFHRQCLFLRPQPHAAIAIPIPIATRQLSSTPSLRKGRKDRSSMRSLERYSTNISTKAELEKLMSDPDFLPEENGCHWTTMVRPPLKVQLAMFSDPRVAFYFQWRILKQRFQDLAMRVRYKFFTKKVRWWGGDSPKMGRRVVVKRAKKLYEDFWTAYANRDEEGLKKVCIKDGNVLRPFLAQLAALPASSTMTWKLEKHLSRPRIMSNKAQALSSSTFKESSLRQIVIKFHTRQTLKTTRYPNEDDTVLKVRKRYIWTPEGMKDVHEEMAKGPNVETHTVDVTEYVVVQRLMKRGVEEDWKIYGFTKPMEGVKDIEAGDEYGVKMRMYEEQNGLSSAV